MADALFSSITTAYNLIKAADYTTPIAAKVYIKNTSTTAAEYINVELGATNVVLGRLYAGDWTLLPWDGANDIDIDTSAVNMTVSGGTAVFRLLTRSESTSIFPLFR